MPSPTLTEAVTFTAYRSDGIIEGSSGVMKNKTSAKKVASATTVRFHVCLTQDGSKLFEKIVAKCRGRGMVLDGAELQEARNSVAQIVIMSGLEITAGLHGVPLTKK